jgi:hypothetical protein
VIKNVRKITRREYRRMKNKKEGVWFYKKSDVDGVSLV